MRKLVRRFFKFSVFGTQVVYFRVCFFGELAVFFFNFEFKMFLIISQYQEGNGLIFSGCSEGVVIGKRFFWSVDIRLLNLENVFDVEYYGWRVLLFQFVFILQRFYRQFLESYVGEELFFGVFVSRGRYSVVQGVIVVIV